MKIGDLVILKENCKSNFINTVHNKIFTVIGLDASKITDGILYIEVAYKDKRFKILSSHLELANEVQILLYA